MRNGWARFAPPAAGLREWFPTPDHFPGAAAPGRPGGIKRCSFLQFCETRGARLAGTAADCPEGSAASADGQRVIQQPYQLPLRVKMGGAVVHSIKENRQTGNAAVADDFQFVHGAALPRREKAGALLFVFSLF